MRRLLAGLATVVALEGGVTPAAASGTALPAPAVVAIASFSLQETGTNGLLVLMIVDRGLGGLQTPTLHTSVVECPDVATTNCTLLAADELPLSAREFWIDSSGATHLRATVAGRAATVDWVRRTTLPQTEGHSWTYSGLAYAAEVVDYRRTWNLARGRFFGARLDCLNSIALVVTGAAGVGASYASHVAKPTTTIAGRLSRTHGRCN